MKGPWFELAVVSSGFIVACAEPVGLTTSAMHQAVVTCAAGPTVAGIDVSKWQGDIDWDAVSRSEMEFAFVRVSDGLTVPDAYFADNWSKVAEHGMVRGVYQFFRPNQDPIAQADLLIDAIGGLRDGDLPPVIDIEVTGGVSPQGIVDASLAWIERVEDRLGVTPIVYTGRYFWETEVDDHPGLSDYPLWIPHWQADCPNLPGAWSDWLFFQFTDRGSVPGVDGDVDVNLFNGDLDDLRAWTVGASCEKVGKTGAIIDDGDRCFEAAGSMIKTREAGFGGSLHYAKTTDLAVSEIVGQWNLDMDAAGRYRIEVHSAASYGSSRHARYQVAHSGELSLLALDQRDIDGWITLGELDFEEGAGQWIRLSNYTGEGPDRDVTLVYDAIRLTPVTEPPPQDDDGGEMGSRGPVEGGCSTTNSEPWLPWAVVFFIAAATRRRRRA